MEKCELCPEPVPGCLSRAFVCSKCNHPIHDSVQRLFFVNVPETNEEAGPFHETCSYVYIYC